MRHIKALVAGVLLSIGALATAEESIEVWGRSYDYSCGYFSRRAVDLSFTLRDPALEYGTQVKAIVGFKGMLMLGGPNSRALSWEDRVIVTATAIDASTWEAKLTDLTLHSRSSGKFLENAQFVFEISHPDGRVEYRNGGSSWGYFETKELNAMVECVRDGELPDWRPVAFGVVFKQ